jgi:hypothetical protein
VTRITTKTHKSARESLARIMRRYFEGEIDDKVFKNLVYGFSVLCAYYKLAQDQDIEAKIDEVLVMVKENREI